MVNFVFKNPEFELLRVQSTPSCCHYSQVDFCYCTLGGGRNPPRSFCILNIKF